jgi:hypothetical protein
MAAMTSADITYAQQSASVVVPGRTRRVLKLTFPTGGTNNQYVTGGIPLDKAKMGCPRGILTMKVLGHTPAGTDLDPIWDWNGNGTTPTMIATRVGSAAGLRLTQQLPADVAYGINEQNVFVEVEGS